MLLNNYRLRLPLGPEPERKVTRQMMRTAHVPHRFWNARIALIPKTTSYRAELEHYVSDVHETERKGRGLLLYGSVGRGKTSAAVAVLKQVMARGCMSPFFVRYDDFTNAALDFRAPPALPSGERITDAARCAHFLILDDLMPPQSDAARRHVESLIRYRYDNYLPTFVTTNLKVDEVQTHMPWYASLLGEVGREIDGDYQPGPYFVVEVDDIDWRMEPGC